MAEPGRYKMGTIVRLTGFTPALLRAWERRHDVLEPRRGPGGHRLYTEEDLLVLRHIRGLLNQGRSIGEIATVGREGLLEAARNKPSTSPSGPEDPRPATTADETLPRPGAQLTRIRHSIIEAALAMDEERIERSLDEAFSAFSPEVVIHEVIERCALEIGDLWIKGRCSVASEHFASGVFVHRLRKLIEAAGPQSRTSPHVIFCCFPDENHELGILILAYHFARFGCRISYLGPALPFEDLERACNVVGPQAVVLSVTRESLYLTHKPRLIELLKRHQGKVSIFVGGQGAPETDAEVTEVGGGFCPNTRPTRQRVEEMVSRAKT